MIFNKALTDTERIQVEGYLAWKWNLITSLPNSHPYSYLNQSFTSTYIGISTPYEVLLTEYVPNPSITSFYIRYNTNISNPINLVLIDNVPIIQDEKNNYIVKFNVQFPSTNTYYIYLTDSNGNIYKSITTPISVTDASSLITLNTETPTVNINTILKINLTLGNFFLK